MSVSADGSDRHDQPGRSPLVGDRPLVMGILNVTPDSFSDGGAFLSIDDACRRARAMVAEGCDIIDVGGESTRPGARPVSVDEELARVVPVVEALTREFEIPVSIDTSKAAVMSAAVEAGAGMINDVRALRTPGALAMAASLDVPVCLMHMRGDDPRTMQDAVVYDDVCSEVRTFLEDRVAAAMAAGIDRRRLIIDPGFGFGKQLADNLSLLHGLAILKSLGLPILVGLSRKSMIGQLLSLPVEARLPASLALAVIAVMHGATIIRVHDVRETVEAVRICQAVIGQGGDDRGHRMGRGDVE